MLQGFDPSILLLLAVAVVPLAVFFLLFKPRPFTPPKDAAEPASVEALRPTPDDSRREPVMAPPWVVPGKTVPESDKDETFFQFLERRAHNHWTAHLYMLIPLAALGVVMAVALLLALFT